jgi:hypothetical protein
MLTTGKRFPGLHYGQIITMNTSGDINTMRMANTMQFISTVFNNAKGEYCFVLVAN